MFPIVKWLFLSLSYIQPFSINKDCRNSPWLSRLNIIFRGFLYNCTDYSDKLFTIRILYKFKEKRLRRAMIDKIGRVGRVIQSSGREQNGVESLVSKSLCMVMFELDVYLMWKSLCVSCWEEILLLLQ